MAKMMVMTSDDEGHDDDDGHGHDDMMKVSSRVMMDMMSGRSHGSERVRR